MKRYLTTAFLYTIVTTVLLGLVYPIVITLVAQGLFRDKANGQMISKDGKIIGSRIIAQPSTADKYFHPRPSAAGANGYDAQNSAGTNYGPTNQKLIDRMNASVAAAHAENPQTAIPADMLTTSASGLDPDISLANAEFQAPRVARARHMSMEDVRAAIRQHTQARQWGFLGEPRVNVLELDLALDQR